jgi:hypothetical protein
MRVEAERGVQGHAGTQNTKHIVRYFGGALWTRENAPTRPRVPVPRVPLEGALDSRSRPGQSVRPITVRPARALALQLPVTSLHTLLPPVAGPSILASQ